MKIDFIYHWNIFLKEWNSQIMSGMASMPTIVAIISIESNVCHRKGVEIREDFWLLFAKLKNINVFKIQV